MERKAGQNFEFQIDQIANDSPPLRDQREWRKARNSALAQYGNNSIFLLVPEDGRRGIAPAVYALVRSGFPTIDKLARTQLPGLVLSMGNFSRLPEHDTLDKIDLLLEKAIETVKRNPVLLGRN